MTRSFFATVAACVATLAPALGAAQHPDFSGLYFPAGRQQDPQRPVYTPAAAAALAEYEKAFQLDDDPGRYCQWPGMPRAIWGAPFTVEIQQRPQDITIYWEGYGMYRKIYMADHDPPEAILPSAMGHSVAHWEGDTLVVETTNLKQYPYMTRQATSSSAHVVERIRLEYTCTDALWDEYLSERGLTLPDLDSFPDPQP
jgi:hypothetical protein